jgi:hypothetical protein
MLGCIIVTGVRLLSELCIKAAVESHVCYFRRIAIRSHHASQTDSSADRIGLYLEIFDRISSTQRSCAMEISQHQHQHCYFILSLSNDAAARRPVYGSNASSPREDRTSSQSVYPPTTVLFAGVKYGVQEGILASKSFMTNSFLWSAHACTDGGRAWEMGERKRHRGQ